MNIKKMILLEIIAAINYNYSKNRSLITVGLIKKINGIDKSNRSRTVLYIHHLKFLEKLGFIKRDHRFSSTSKARYKILKRISSFKFDDGKTVNFEINICDYCRTDCKKKFFHINISRNETHVFCSKECKLRWIFSKIKGS